MKVKVRLDTLSDIKGFVNAVSPIATEVHLTDGNNLTVSAKCQSSALCTQWSGAKFIAPATRIFTALFATLSWRSNDGT